MGKSKKPRKAYVAKFVDPDPLARLRKATPAERAKIMTRFYSALHEVTNGAAPDRPEWRDLSDAINTVETLALALRKLVPAEVMPTINAAIEGMVFAAQRLNAGQPMRLSGRGIQALRDVLAIYDQCLLELTYAEMAHAQAETERRLLAAKTSKHRRADLVEV